MKVSVIVPTRNHGHRLAVRLQALFRQTLPAEQYEVVVVDNGSTDATAQVLAQLSTDASNLRWVIEPVPGRALARNRGICEARGDLLVFLDDDIEIQPDNLERHLAYHARSVEPVAVISRVVDASPVRPSWLEGYFRVRQIAGSPRSSTATSCAPLGFYFATGNVSLLRSTLQRVVENGNASVYFDPSLLMRQDGDLGCRLVKAGVQLVFADDIVCYHHHPRDLHEVLRRSYEAGYYTVRLLEKHPEVSSGVKNLTASAWVNGALLVACIALFVPAFLLRPLWPEAMSKVTGAYLLHYANRGYQRALKDRRKVSA